MYRAHWKLKDKPFENTADPRFLYLTPQHEEGLSRLRYVVEYAKGAGMLTGVFGCGKTLLTRVLLTQLDQMRYRIGFVRDPQVSHIDLLRLIARSLGTDEPPVSKSDLLILIERTLTKNFDDGKQSVVIIDDAHAIPSQEVFEQIRLLLNFQLETSFLLTILLIGQSELRNKIDANKQLAQRIAISHHLGPLTQEETSRYIRHRLTVADAGRDIFTEGAMKLVFQDSGGIPRRINQICDMGLFTGYGNGAEVVDEATIGEAINALGL